MSNTREAYIEGLINAAAIISEYDDIDDAVQALKNTIEIISKMGN